MRPRLRKGIYALLDGENESFLLERGKTLLRFPICALQIRAKGLSDAARSRLANALHAEFRRIGGSSRFVINDDLELAKSLGCDLHLGQEDNPPLHARKVLGPNVLIGLSTHSLAQVDLANRAFGDGLIDYIGFGPIFSTSSKKDALPPRGSTLLRQVLSQSVSPVVAIGGLSWKNLSMLSDMGLERFALLSQVSEGTLDETALAKWCVPE